MGTHSACAAFVGMRGESQGVVRGLEREREGRGRCVRVCVSVCVCVLCVVSVCAELPCRTIRVRSFRFVVPKMSNNVLDDEVCVRVCVCVCVCATSQRVCYFSFAIPTPEMLGE